MKRISLLAFAVYAVVVIATSARPFGNTPKQMARAGHEIGLCFAREGDYQSAKRMFEATRETAPVGSYAWNVATVMLAVTCENLGQLEEADYYFASEYAKHSNMANEARNQFEGAWRNVRRIAEKQGERI